MMKIPFLLLTVTLLTACTTTRKVSIPEANGGETVPTTQSRLSAPSSGVAGLKGEFAQIDLQRSRQVMADMNNGNMAAINVVLQHPNDYIPPVLYLVADTLFYNGYRDEAMFWFYTAQLRAGSDANKSADQSTSNVVSRLNRQLGSRIIPYSLSVPEQLENTVEQVLAWDKQQSRNYDPRWISLEGQDAKSETRIKFAPKEKWAEIDTLTRRQFRQGLELELTMSGLRSLQP